MTDNEFIEELAARLTLFLEGDRRRATSVLTCPLGFAGYANVGHFLGQLALPRGLDHNTSAEQLEGTLFLTPVIEEGIVTKFEAIPGRELDKRHQEAAERMKEAQKDDSKIH